jgi:hypothetical protein
MSFHFPNRNKSPTAPGLPLAVEVTNELASLEILGYSEHILSANPLPIP